MSTAKSDGRRDAATRRKTARSWPAARMSRTTSTRSSCRPSARASPPCGWKRCATIRSPRADRAARRTAISRCPTFNSGPLPAGSPGPGAPVKLTNPKATFEQMSLPVAGGHRRQQDLGLGRRPADRQGPRRRLRARDADRQRPGHDADVHPEVREQYRATTSAGCGCRSARPPSRSRLDGEADARKTRSTKSTRRWRTPAAERSEDQRGAVGRLASSPRRRLAAAQRRRAASTWTRRPSPS